ncbi:MAG: glycosyl hydrolase [FCB group bacterium]|jgi:hypothetical protein|nr:glycosyl hydrolase [FCB group bacterium]
MKRRLMCVLAGMALFTCGALAAPEDSARPWVYWDWMGSAVDRENISALLKQYAEGGLGGVHIVPIYGVKGVEDRFIQFLSPQWMEMLAFTVSEAKRVGMGVDMSTGTGWPFGGPMVNDATAATKLVLDSQPVEQGKPVSAPAAPRLLTVVVRYADGSRADVTAEVKAGNWAPSANGTLYLASLEPTGQKVKRAAPGGEGPVLDPFSAEAMQSYLAAFDNAFANYPGPFPRGQYHDSYEYYGASATEGIFDIFQQDRGYDLRSFLPELKGDGNADLVARVRNDYRAVLDAELARYIGAWVDWSRSKGCITRYQAHGSPGNLLDLYALADVPETEIFGPSGYPIPGLRTEFRPITDQPNPLVIKFASSAAHVAGRNLASSETCTWLGEHFRIPFTLVKPELDQFFTAGINHIFYHTLAYSPKDAPWPGWLFYASTNFAPSNTQWPHFRALNDYAARVQAALREGAPDNDVLLYFPIHDIWQRPSGALNYQMGVHDDSWLNASGFGDTARWLWRRGYGCDYASDKQLLKAKASNGLLQTDGATYAAVVVPRCRFMPIETLRQLLELSHQGVPVLFPEGPPQDVPGLHDLEARRAAFAPLREEALLAPHGDLMPLLSTTTVKREAFPDKGLRFIRRKHDDGYTYFISNLGDREFDGWADMGTRAESAVFTDPMRGDRSGRATWIHTDNGDRCYVQLAAGESVLLRTYTGQAPESKEWAYLRPVLKQATTLTAPWDVTFLEGGPQLPEPRHIEKLESWTEWGEEAAQFGGLTRYRTAFQRPGAGEYILDLGDVRESARVVLNGRVVATLFALPFRVPVGDYLRDGENELILEVANLGANRIAAMDRQGVDWRHYYEINFVNILYKPFDASAWDPVPSGLLGPIKLIPAEVIREPQT